MVNLLSQDRAQPFVFGITAPFIEKLLSPNLNEHQIRNRTIAIMDSAPFLLADATSSPDKKRRLVQSRLEKISFLFDLGTEQIVERASIMRTYFENKVVGYHHLSDPNRLTGRTYNEVLRNASSLDNRTLESRLGIIKSQVDTLKSLAGIKRESETLTATIIPQELSAYAAGLTLNNEDLVNRFNGIKDLFTPKKAEPANNFMDFLELYKTKIPLPSGGPAVGPSSSAS
ncbi:MAG: hypothetical protein K2X28_02715 [Alphaproteobacteria bacterium]|nr:hypothetical protein [Alphaproteobacteria bacterium]